MRTNLVFIFYLFFIGRVFPQGNSVSGKIVDKESGLPVYGAVITLMSPGNTTLSTEETDFTISDMYGNFHLDPKNTYSSLLKASHMGYKTLELDSVRSGPNTLLLEMEIESIPLNEVTVTSYKFNDNFPLSPVPISVVTENIIKKLPALTLSDVLAGEPGISVVRDGPWATSLNIRGLSEQRIVVLVDGNRIETATDIAGALSTIDLQDIEKVEVIKGGCSSLYGNGAMGGIVNIYTRQGEFDNRYYFHGSAGSEYNTVNHMLGEDVSLFTGANKWHGKISIANRNATDIRTPAGIQENSQFNDRNISAFLAIKPLKSQELEFNFQNFKAWNAGIPGGTAFPVNALATYKNAGRYLFSTEYNIRNLSRAFTELSIKYFSQTINRQVDLLPNTPPQVSNNLITTAEKFTPVGNHLTNGIQLNLRWKMFRLNEMVYGVDAWQRRMTSTREKLLRQDHLDSLGNIISTTYMIQGEEPVPSSTFSSSGIFFQDRMNLAGGKLVVITGGRIDRVYYRNGLALDPLYLIQNGKRNDSPPGQVIIYAPGHESLTTWALNTTWQYNFSDQIKISANLARSFRAPSLEEKYKYIDLGSMVQLGNPALKPEDGFFFDTGLKLLFNKLNFAGNIYYNYLKNLIALSPADSVTFPYADTQQGTTAKIYAMRNYNVDRAVLYGYDLTINYNVNPETCIYTNLGYVRGKDIASDENLPWIPPLNGITGIRLRWPGYLEIDMSSVYFTNQDKVATGETITRGYTVFNGSLNSIPIRLSGLGVQVFCGVENIFNRSYIYPLATYRGENILAPARNFYFKTIFSW